MAITLLWSQGSTSRQEPTETQVSTAPRKSRYKAAQSNEPWNNFISVPGTPRCCGRGAATSKGTRERGLNPSSDSSWIPENPRPPFWQEQKSFQGSTACCNQTRAQTLILRASVLKEGEFSIDFCDQMFSGCSEHTSNPLSPFYLPLSQAF